jgi:hypothetical protein
VHRPEAKKLMQGFEEAVLAFGDILVTGRAAVKTTMGSKRMMGIRSSRSRQNFIVADDFDALCCLVSG